MHSHHIIVVRGMAMRKQNAEWNPSNAERERRLFSRTYNNWTINRLAMPRSVQSIMIQRIGDEMIRLTHYALWSVADRADWPKNVQETDPWTPLRKTSHERQVHIHLMSAR
jgi:hypothetical protein